MQKKKDEHRIKKRFIIYISLFGLFIITILLFSLYRTSRMNDVYFTAMTSLHESQNNVTESHLWLEEYLTGDASVDIDMVLQDLHYALDNINIIQQVIVRERNLMYSLFDIPIDEQLSELRKSISRIIILSRERIALVQESLPGSEIDEEYDAEFEQFRNLITEIKATLETEIADDYNIFKYNQYAFLIVMFSVFISLIIIYINSERKRLQYINDLEQLTESLQEENNKRKKAEEVLQNTNIQLEERKQQYKMVVENSPMGILHINTESEIYFVNEKLLSILGTTRDRLIGFNILQQAQDNKLLDSVSKTLKGVNTIFETEYQSVTGSNTTPVRGYFNPIIEDGKTIGGVGLIEDISDQYRAEKAYKTLVDYSLQGIAIFQNNRIVFANNTLASMTGYTIDELLEMSEEKLNNLIHSDDIDRIWSNMYKRLESNEIEGNNVYTFRKKDASLWFGKLYAAQSTYNNEDATQVSFMDVTGEIENENKLLESEKRYRSLVEAMNEGMVVVNENSVITYANKRFLEMIAYSSDELYGMTVFDIIHNDDMDLLKSELTERRKGADKKYEIRLKTSNKSFITVLISPKSLFDDTGTFIGSMSVATDITRQKEIQNELREKETNLKITLESIGDAVIVCDAQGRITRLNSIAETLTGWDRTEAIGKQLTEVFVIVNSFTKEPAENPVEKVLRSGKVEGLANHTELISRNGKIYQVADSAAPIMNEYNETIGVVMVFRDVTEKYEQEQEIKDNEFKLRTAQSIAKLGYWEYDIKQNVFWGNDRVREIFGVLANEEALTKDKIIKNVHPDDKEMHDSSLNSFLSNGTTYDLKFRIIRGTDDAVAWLHSVAELIYDENNEPIKAVGTIQDITEQKMYENKLRSINEELEIRVDERTNELQELNAVLEEEIQEHKQTEQALQVAKENAESANRAKSEFLANISHELRTPLNGILGFAQILKRDEKLTESMTEGIDTILSSGEHLLNLINDILDLSKVEARKLELSIDDFYLPGMINGIVSITKLKAEQKKLAFEYRTPSPLPAMVCGDERKLRQILLNLLGNAIKFTYQGKVILTIDSDVISAGRQKLFISVQDTGIGIPKESIREIFKPFNQLDTNKSNPEGTGLGLAISKKLVELMGGELQVQSDLGEGSMFWFEIELTNSLANVDDVAHSDQLIVGYANDPKSILVVDDKDENRKVLQGLLQAIGFTIYEAATGTEAIDIARNKIPELILMDLVMPFMDGFETTQRLKKIPELKSTKIIAVSASTFEVTKKKTFEHGFDDFISKPIQSKKLIEILENHLQIQWLYKEKIGEKITETDIKKTDGGLSKQSVKNLRTYIEDGDFSGLHDLLVSLENDDTINKNILRELRKFVETFQLDKINEYIDRFSNGG